MKTFLKLLRFELKKMFCRKYILIVCLALVAALGVYMCVFFNVDQSEYAGENRLYSKIEGPLTEEKYQFLMDELKEAKEDADADSRQTGKPEKGLYSLSRELDALLIESALSKCDFILENEKNRMKIIARAKENLVKYDKNSRSGNSYTASYNRKIIKYYSKQPQVFIISPLGKNAWYTCLKFNIHSFMILLFLILLTPPLFAQEKENGMKDLTDSYVSGYGKLFFSKTAAAVAGTILTVVIFEGAQLLLFKILIPEMRGEGYPIQTVFPRCPFRFSIGGFLVIKFFSVLAASLTVTSFIILFSVIFSRRSSAIAASAAFTFAIYGTVFYQKIWSTEIMREGILKNLEQKLSAMKTFLFTYLYYPADYYETYSGVNILGHAVFPQTVALIIAFLAAVLSVTVSYKLYKSGGRHTKNSRRDKSRNAAH